MRSLTTSRFWALYASLPLEVRQLADKNFHLWMDDPRHPSLQFKPFKGEYWSVRIGLHYRAVGKFVDEYTFLWGWIGHHAEYDRF